MPTAMVKAPPKKPRRRSPPPSDDPYAALKDILDMFGNTRAYTFLGFADKGWRVHFAGDLKPSIVTFEDEKPVIIEEG